MVIIVSGFVQTMVSEKLERMSVKAIMEKPIDNDDLLIKVREVLDESI